MKKDVIVDYVPSLRPSASVVTHHLKVILPVWMEGYNPHLLTQKGLSSLRQPFFCGEV